MPDPTGPMILCSWVEAVLREQLLRAERKSVSGAPGAPQKSNLKSTSSIYWSQSFDERQRGHEQIRAEVGRLLQSFGRHQADSGHVFNLGHGISQHTDPEAVAVLVDAVHELSRPLHTGV